MVSVERESGESGKNSMKLESIKRYQYDLDEWNAAAKINL